MAHVMCPECGEEVSDPSPTCSKCDAPPAKASRATTPQSVPAQRHKTHPVTWVVTAAIIPQYIYDASGEAVGFINGRYIHDMSGNAMGQLNGTHVYKLSGEYVSELYKDMVVDTVADYGNIGNAGNPGNAGAPGNPRNRGIIDYGYPDASAKLSK